MVLLVMLVLVLTAVAPTRGLPTCPPGGSYFDEHTNRRECCAGICEHAIDDNTIEQCKLLCPGYDSAIQFRARSGHGVVKEAGSDSKTPPEKPPQPPEGPDDDGGSEKAVIIGVVIGVIGVVAAVAGGLAVVYFRRKRKGGRNDASPTKSPTYKQVAKVDTSHS